MMNEYEKNFTDVVYQRLKEKVKGKVTVYVDWDTLFIKVANFDVNFEMRIERFSHKLIMMELDIPAIVDEFVGKYRYYLLNGYFYL